MLVRHYDFIRFGARESGVVVVVAAAGGIAWAPPGARRSLSGDDGDGGPGGLAR